MSALLKFHMPVADGGTNDRFNYNPRESAAANLVAMQADNEKLRSSYYRDKKNGNLSEHKLNYPPKFAGNLILILLFFSRNISAPIT